MVDERSSGIVKWFSANKGYGFIEVEGEKDIFVHYSDITMDGFKVIAEGDMVWVDIENSDKGPKAVNVIPK